MLKQSELFFVKMGRMDRKAHKSASCPNVPEEKGRMYQLIKLYHLSHLLLSGFFVNTSCGSHIVATKIRISRGQITSEEKQELEKSEKRAEPMGV